jgi:hypothetical protein
MSFIEEDKRPKKRKSHFDLISRTQIYKNKKAIESRIQNVQNYCHGLGLEITNLTIMKYDQNNLEKKEKPIINYIGRQNNDATSNNTLLKALKAKDLSNLSDRGYNLFLKSFEGEINMPSISELFQYKKELNRLFPVESNLLGVYNKPKEKIQFVCSKFIEKYGFFENNQIILKLSGDSLNITRTGIHLLNFTFAIIDERENPMSVDGNYLLGLVILHKDLKKKKMHF